ncbi:hypothetical protein M407DRAFT_17729 [Tulasnella calospora MUT 4182]|uniref:Transcription factor IIIC 90kDa subunit N-terminal domain-containing protein n=1 Tax=Tulasnella calospora MUT 4182 TaxID=1051891 RepID=A0A0C3LHM8_9AGAM|nr:hypothetical protein M407DRAFT_17729 [Tulasnella calospora MUT 4182]
MTLHAALSLLAESTPAFGNLSWSEDGQLCVLTHNAIYILTPDLGFFFDTESAISATPTISSSEPTPKLGWYRTMLAVDKASPHVWALESENQAVLVTGSMDIMFKAASWSPTGLSTDGLSLLAILTSNLEISLYEPSRNHLKGAWNKVQDVTEALKQYFQTNFDAKDTKDRIAAKILAAQAQAIAWSEAPPMNRNRGGSFAKHSLLAVGSRGGTVVLLRSKVEATELEVVAAHTFTNQWIVCLSWSSWSTGNSGDASCVLACALPDGSVQQLRVSLPSGADDAKEVAVEHLAGQSCGRVDRRGITAMTWADVHGKESLLVYTKPGTIHIWSQTLGLRTLVLERQAVCAGSSSLVPAIGVVYDGGRDSIIVSLSDSSLHVVYQASTNPTLSPPQPSESSFETLISSINLSLTSRSFSYIVEKLETQRSLDAGDLAATSGLTAFDEFGTMAWFAEMIRPQDLDYKPSARRKSTLIVARLYDDDPNGDTLLNYVKKVLDNPKCGQPPVARLRTALLHLRNSSRYAAVRDRLLSMLSKSDMTEDSSNSVEMATSPVTYASELVSVLGTTPKLQGAYLRFTLAHSCAKFRVRQGGSINSGRGCAGEAGDSDQDLDKVH